MSAEFYRVLHLASLFIFISGLGISFFSDNTFKLNKILTGISSLLILVAGMGLIAKQLEIGHGEAWPKWLHVKILIWAIAAIGGPIMAKRMKEKKAVAFYGILALMIVAIYVVVHKPF